MITFTTGTINQPDAGSVGLAMAEKIRDDVVAHAAWELVEEFTPASGLVRWYVFKNLATESLLPSDFYVVMGRTLGSGELRFAICEGYNSTTHVMSSMAPTNSAPVTYDSSGRNPATYTLSTAVFSGAANTPKYMSWIPSGTSTKWWLTVAEDGFTVAFNGASNGFIHLGAYIPLTVLPIDMPIQIVGSSTQDGAITRNPAVASTTTGGSSGQALSINGGGFSGVDPNYGPPLGFQGALKYNDKLQNNQRPMAEQGIMMQAGSVGFQEVYGWALGKQKRMRQTNQQTPTGFAFGDAYVLSGNLWVPHLPTDGRIWDTGVAA